MGCTHALKLDGCVFKPWLVHYGSFIVYHFFCYIRETLETLAVVREAKEVRVE